MDVLTSLIVVKKIHIEYTHISKYHIVYPKYVQI